MSEPCSYVKCESYLAQGDIFTLHVVSPYADPEIRIFRTLDGQHGKKIFEDDSFRGKIYGYKDLVDMGIYPFEDMNEFVITYASLVEHFILASQTCDVSGLQSRQKPYAVILPFVTLFSFLTEKKLPIEVDKPENLTCDFRGWDTITNYLEKKLGCDFSKFRGNPFLLPSEIRKTIDAWTPQKRERTIRNQIRKFINDLLDNRKKYIYYLPNCYDLGIPEGFADLTRLFTIPTKTLQHNRSYRTATIATPYRDEFSKKLADYYCRIATPGPLQPTKI